MLAEEPPDAEKTHEISSKNTSTKNFWSKWRMCRNLSESEGGACNLPYRHRICQTLVIVTPKRRWNTVHTLQVWTYLLTIFKMTLCSFPENRWFSGFSETFPMPQRAPGVVGTCKLDTHEFNTNDLQKIYFYVENFIFSKKFRPKQKTFFRKISKFEKSRFKWKLQVNPGIFENFGISQNFRGPEIASQTIRSKSVW